MKKYKLQFDKRFIKDLKRVPHPFRENICKKIESLVVEPRPHGYIKLNGSKKIDLYRIRCGDYRIVYTIQDFELVIIIIELGHRKEIHRNL